MFPVGSIRVRASMRSLIGPSSSGADELVATHAVCSRCRCGARTAYARIVPSLQEAQPTGLGFLIR